MNELFTAQAQRNLTYLWLVGFFAILILSGWGYLKDVPMDSLFTMTGVVLFFWFNRSRPQETPPNTQTTLTNQTVEILPKTPAPAPKGVTP